VIGTPAVSMRRSAETARRRVCSARRREAVSRCWVLSARIGCRCGVVGVDLADHAVEVGEDVGVHLGHSGLPVGLRVVDEGEGPAAVLAQLGWELGPGEEHRAGQAGVGVRQDFCTGSPQ